MGWERALDHNNKWVCQGVHTRALNKCISNGCNTSGVYNVYFAKGLKLRKNKKDIDYWLIILNYGTTC